MSSTPRPRSTRIEVEALADCPFSMAEEYAAEYLRSAEAHGPAAMIYAPWPIPLPWLHRRVAITFGTHGDRGEEGRGHDELRVRWASGSRLLPDFHGSVSFRIAGANTRVLVAGTYLPPLGAAGPWFDGLIGRHVARGSLADLARRLAAYLTQREDAWRIDHPAPQPAG